MGQSASGSKGVSEVVGADRNRPGGGEETGGRVNNKIKDRVGGGGGDGIKRGLGSRGGVSGSERFKWSGMEQGGGQMSDQPRQTTVRKHGREVQSRENLNLEGQSLVL